MNSRKTSNIIRAQISEFSLPPITDGLVLGKNSPIGCVAVGKALSLLTTTSFEHLQIDDDDVIGDVLIRSAILRKANREQIINFVLQEIKPVMGAEEIIHLDLKVEILLEVKQS
ncbi:MAG: hypothetical protein HOP04_12460 [Methylophilaceae bacterium]|nr:hypothetical protein [Methylophilaceae bacterium]